MKFDLLRSASASAKTAMRRATSHLAPSAWALAACAGALVVTAPGLALSAEAPSCDLECGLGFVCELAPVACPAIFCLDENDPNCPRCDGEPEPFCSPAPCESDDQCGDGTVCAEHTAFVDCPVSAPAPASHPSSRTKAAADPEAIECTPTSIKLCTPRWQLPCETDVDCGAGFRCEEQQSCSVPAAPSDPDARERAAPAEVTCEPSGIFACMVVETPCVTDADCAAQLVCADNPNQTCSATYDRPACIVEGPAKLCTPEITAVGYDSIGGVPTAAPASSPSVQTEMSSDADRSSGASSCAMGTGRTPASVPTLSSALGLAALLALLRGRAELGRAPDVRR